LKNDHSSVEINFIGDELMGHSTVVVKSISLSWLNEHCPIEIDIENVMNFRHSMIVPEIGGVFEGWNSRQWDCTRRFHSYPSYRLGFDGELRGRK
jgi:hypothetical protein